MNIDPELEPILPLLPSIGMDDPVAARQWIKEMAAQTPREAPVDKLNVEDVLVGDEGVRVRVYSPLERSGPVPGLLYIHGGGFVIGDIDTEHAGAATVADSLGIVVVSVDYRLAPEHPYPAGIEDCYAALRWMTDEAGKLGVDLDRVGVAGQSAGGGLAAGIALLARDRQGPALCFQLLGIPELDDRLETPSMRAFVDTPMWSRPSAILSWKYYLAGCGEDVPIYAAPARAEDLAGLPPAYVSVAENDPLRDEGIIYASRLVQAGVSTELHMFPGTFHGSVIVPTATVSKRQTAEMIDALRRGLRV